MKNQWISLSAAGVLTLAALMGCSGVQNSGTAASSTEAMTQTSGESTTVASEISGGTEEKIKILTTSFYQFDWLREIIGDKMDRFELEFLLDDGVDLHNYQTTAEDIAKLADSDLFVYTGGESDAWVSHALRDLEKDEHQVIDMLALLGDRAKFEEIIDGMEDHDHAHAHEEESHDHDHDMEESHDHDYDMEESHDHDHDTEDAHDHDHDEEGDHDHSHEHEGVYDEHVWLSLENAIYYVKALALRVSDLDPDNAAVYSENSKEYIKKLSALHARYLEEVNTASRDTILFGDRFPFRYLVDDYDLDYYAAFVGCSAETEASFETIIFLAGKMDELDLKNVLVIETSDGKLAETIIANTKNKDQEILVLDSLQSVYGKDAEAGLSYLGVMEENLEVLKKALQ